VAYQTHTESDATITGGPSRGVGTPDVPSKDTKTPQVPGIGIALYLQTPLKFAIESDA
jgi:hypothetical protein